MFSSNAVLEEFIIGSLKASPLMKPFLTPGSWVTQGEMSVLACFSGLVVGAYVKH